MGVYLVACARNRRVYKRVFEDPREACEHLKSKSEVGFICFITDVSGK